MMTETWRGFSMSSPSTGSTRSSPPKRSFDVAFLTGIKDTLTEERLKDDPILTSKFSKSSVTLIVDQSPPPSPEESSAVNENISKNIEIKDHSRNGGSAFTKVLKSHGPSVSPTSRETAVSFASSLSSSSWPPAPTPFTAMSSLLSGTKSLSPLMGSHSFLSPALMPLLGSSAAMNNPDSINNNLVEEYLKSHHEFLASKTSTTEALSRLRSTVLPHTDAYKLPFAGLPYPLGRGSISGGGSRTTNKSNSNPFLPQNSVSALMPSTLTALSLPSQNVCAKCNISFRMTSDLVYHMRSQHKKEPDPYIKRRNEKLKCPICQESFRERHHLTRHMTAHQDRAEEAEANK